MRPDDAPCRHRAAREDATAATDADEQLRDVALTLDLARSCYEAWQATDLDTSPGVALRYAYHTHDALHELSRVVDSLIETFRVEASGLLVPPPRHRHAPSVPMTPAGPAEGGRLLAVDTQAELTVGARTAPGRPVLHRTVPATAVQLTALRHELAVWAKASELAVDQVEVLVLASYEALTNVAEHAYPTDTTGTVTLAATCTDDTALVVISDRGCWRAPPTGQNDRGHGLALMHTLTDDVQINHAETGTTVHLRWNVVLRPADPGSDASGNGRPAALA
ncbi:MAG: ATP-binding protein, partial [Pseudonocardiaceae bacterium]